MQQQNKVIGGFVVLFILLGMIAIVMYNMKSTDHSSEQEAPIPVVQDVARTSDQLQAEDSVAVRQGEVLENDGTLSRAGDNQQLANTVNIVDVDSLDVTDEVAAKNIDELTATNEVCGDGLDNDNDGFVDAADFDCAEDADVESDEQGNDSPDDLQSDNGGDTSNNAFTEIGCGSTHGQTLSAPPKENLCVGGAEAAQQTGNGPWKWACLDVSGAVTGVCEAASTNVVVQDAGVCGTLVNSCTSGTFIDTEDIAGQAVWGCIGSGGFENFAECSVPQ